MKYFNRIYTNLYYKALDLLLPGKKILLPPSLIEKKNIFLYFDYEREFGGNNTKISNNEIELLLKIFSEYKLNSTWFTVGRIFENYPDSIKMVLENSHEIGSHTYDHISPFHTSNSNLNNDFELFDKVSKTVPDIVGFHSPKNQWSIKIFNHLSRLNYLYDVSNCGKKRSCNPIRLMIGFKKYIIRLKTMGDDWQLYNSDFNEDEVMDHFVSLSNSIERGSLGGIGAHPWILFSDEKILKGYNKFLEYLIKQNDVNIKTAKSFVKILANK